MVQIRKPVIRSENIIDRRPVSAARRGRGAAGAEAARRDAEKLLAEIITQAMQYRQRRPR